MTEMQKYPKRKSPRLQGFDYSTAQSYHVVLVTQDRAKVFGRVVDSRMLLSEEGRAAVDLILEIPRHYTSVSVDEFVVMPDHVHMLISIYADPEETSNAKLTDIVRAYKSAVSRQCGRPIWQRSFYDHIIRNEKDYQETIDCIHVNPAEWTLSHE